MHRLQNIRLSRKMAALKFEEAQLSVQKDIDSVTAWSKRFDEHNSRQVHVHEHTFSHSSQH